MTVTSGQQKYLILEIAKWIAVVLMLVFFISLTAGNGDSNAPFESVSEAVTKTLDQTHMTAADNQMVKRIYGLDPAQFEGVLCYSPLTNMDADEVLLIKLTSDDQQDAVREAIEARRDSQMRTFDGYGFEQYAMLEQSIIEVHGNYILYVSSNDPKTTVKAFTDAL